MGAGGFQTAFVDGNLDLILGCQHGCEIKFGCPAEKARIKEGRDPRQLYKVPTEWERVKTFKPGSNILLCGGSDALADDIINWGWFAKILELVNSRPDCKFLILTKQVENVQRALPKEPLPNLYIGTSGDRQKILDWRASRLFKAALAGCVLSLQPIHEAIDIRWYLDNPKIRLVITGCGMGEDSDPEHRDWIDGIWDQCEEYRVNCFITRYRDEDGKFHNPGSHRPTRNKKNSTYGIPYPPLGQWL